MRRELIVNADDFGRSEAINVGVLRAHAEGIVTSASLMVRWPDAVRAARAAREHTGLGVGLHLDLGEWRFVDRTWHPIYEVVDLTDALAVEREAERQLECFRRLMGREPTHLDSHQHVHTEGLAHEAASALSTGLGIPLRGRDVRHCGAFYGRTGEGDRMPELIAPERLIALIHGLPPGVTELSCHPGDARCDDPVYGPERSLELEALIDPRVAAAVRDAGVVLRSFAQRDS